MTKNIRHSALLFTLLLSFISLFTGTKNAFSVCPIPTGLSTTGITTTTAVLNWAPISCDSFLVRYHVTGTVNYMYKTVKPGSLTSTSITGLYPFTNYSWVVHTYCNGGVSGGYQQSPALFTTVAGNVSCVIPNNTTTTSIGPNSAMLSWNPLVQADSFLIRYAPHNTTNYIWIKVPGTMHSYNLTNLPPNASFDWRVRCMCASSPTQSYSISNTFTTLSSNCGTADPYYFAMTNVGYNAAIAGWKAVPGAVSYRIRYAIRYSNNWITLASTGTTKGLTGLHSSTWYEYQVQAICSNGSGPWSSSGIFQTTPSILTLTRGPYLNTSTPTSIYIRWRTGIPSDSRVRYGTSPTNLIYAVNSSTSTTEHIVQLTGLSPNTRYYYSIGSSTVTLQGDTGNTFKTNPVVGSTGPVRIWTIGDFGVSSWAQNQVRDAYNNYPGSDNTNVWLWVGDNAYVDGTDVEYSNHVFSKYPHQFKKWVVWPASGNHDLHSANPITQTGPYYDIFTLPKAGEAGGVPSNTEAYYSFNYGNIHFVCLESYYSVNRATNGAMATWLLNDLNANTQRWTIVYFHHPPYSKGSHNSDVDIESIEMRSNIIPILESKKVDLVLSGHSHSYERSKMINGHYGLESTFVDSTMAVNSGSGTYPTSYQKTSPSFTGTVYVVCGVSGQAGGTTPGWPHDAMYSYSIANYGSLVIDVAGDRLDCKFLNSYSSIYDQFTIQKFGTPFHNNDEKGQQRLASGDKLVIFPNPITEESVIRYIVENNEPVKMEITDMTGRVLYVLVNSDQEKGDYEIQLTKSVAVLPHGVYFIRLMAGEKSYLRKIVVSD